MAMGSVVHLLFFLSEQCYLMPFSTYRIGTGLRANPVCGELPVPLTVVTVILDHTEDHLLVAIREVVRCLFTPLEGMVVPPGEIVLTHPDCRDTLQGH
ncbi:hypothetical protein [Escherichia coli]|nr:hypothetical protein [Escherichia coli]EAO4034391.1 hypothetical protein [Salmonella enterica]ECD7044536.1 hypothetical protein [Salmonella enterica subsp. enterica serovar Typhimurium]ECF3083211.1 hypothetical protein [Salmonella enterica subsp. enterica serovar Berta]ECK8875187.1 hypothetical protein [Salmonella enterica subsp. enterica]ECM1356238.1 hypothetical protein [Salmonella enterica subsp. enterica serovar Enteritidis]EFX1369845.1 hypothetical protein [Shigella sonnei]TSI86291.1